MNRKVPVIGDVPNELVKYGGGKIRKKNNNECQNEKVPKE